MKTGNNLGNKTFFVYLDKIYLFLYLVMKKSKETLNNNKKRVKKYQYMVQKQNRRNDALSNTIVTP